MRRGQRRRARGRRRVGKWDGWGEGFETARDSAGITAVAHAMRTSTTVPACSADGPEACSDRQAAAVEQESAWDGSGPRPTASSGGAGRAAAAGVSATAGGMAGSAGREAGEATGIGAPGMMEAHPPRARGAGCRGSGGAPVRMALRGVAAPAVWASDPAPAGSHRGGGGPAVAAVEATAARAAAPGGAAVAGGAAEAGAGFRIAAAIHAAGDGSGGPEAAAGAPASSAACTPPEGRECRPAPAGQRSKQNTLRRGLGRIRSDIET